MACIDVLKILSQVFNKLVPKVSSINFSKHFLRDLQYNKKE